MTRGPERAVPATDLEARLVAAEADRDALLKAAGWKVGPLGDGLSRKVILEDMAALRPEMVKARQAQSDAERDSLLWQASCEEGQQSALVLKVWKQRRDAERRSKETWQQLRAFWDRLIPPSPRCRDCADFDGRCQGDGPPCDPQAHALERLDKLLAAQVPSHAVPVTGERDAN